MTHPQGGFFSAEDADSIIDPAHPHEKGEGAFYVWTWDEIHSALEPADAAEFCEYYGLKPGGNVSEDPHGEFTHKNILYVARWDDAREKALDGARRKLLEIRNGRPRPHLDDKILTAWNSLMISAFAKGAQVLDDERYRDAATRAAEFIIANMYDASNGTLLRRYRDGAAGISGFLDDYAFFVQALLDLYQTDFDPQRIEMAIGLTDQMRDLFEDRERGGFFTTAEGDASLIMRAKDDYDGAEPSGNSIALMNLLRLAAITGRKEFEESAQRTLSALAARIANQPVAVPQMLAAFEFTLAPHRQIVLAGDPQNDVMRGFIRAAHNMYQPHAVLLSATDDEVRARLAERIPAIAEMKQIENRPTAYVCENFACHLPVHDVSKFSELLK
jgi:uncharacterized protein YyaL (SSP411 family)